MYDVIIVGSGVAGAIAGYYLAAADKKVVILEKETFPRYKTCGGGIVARVADLLPYNLSNVVEKKIKQADVYDHSVNFRCHIERNNPIIYMTMRNKLDSFLLEKAVSNSAVSMSGTKVTDIIQYDDCAEVITTKGSYKAKMVIGADGATGITSKVLGVQKYFKKLPAIESEILVDDLILEKFNKTARFDFGIIPKGYGWVFPKEEHLSVGVLSHDNSGVNLNDCFRDYLNKLGLKGIQKKETHGYIIPVLNKHKKFTFGRILLVGDAAGLADPLTAEGISYAIESAQYAAKAILESGYDVMKTIKNFEFQLKGILKELKYAKILSDFFYSSLSLRNYVMKKFGYRISNLMTDIISGNVQYSKLMTNPANYFKLISPRN